MSSIAEGTLLWEPTAQMQQQSVMHAYMQWLYETHGLQFSHYAELWEWSITAIEAFWESLWQFYDIQASQPYTAVLSARTMPGADWFPGARLNFAEHVFRHRTQAHPAILFESEREPLRAISWHELEQQVAALATALRQIGVQQGDRVAAYIPNIPQAVVGFLACASLGAIWSSCSPDFGDPSVIDRFTQIEPKILFAVDGYGYGGKTYDRQQAVANLRAALPTLEKTILVPYLDPTATPGDDSAMLNWNDLLATEAEPLTFAQVPFGHPLWVLYSSGTTGLPKPIVHGHGGILLEHLKSVNLHMNLQAGDRFFWYTTTGWMMWNYLVGGLLSGCTILVYDGSPGYPDMNRLWDFAARARMTFFGTSAGYLTACMKAGITPGQSYDLSALNGVGSTGSPLPPEGFVWVYEQIKRDLMLVSFSGGTDVCTGFVGGTKLLPIYSGEIQCSHLGCAVRSFDALGNAVVDEVGEFVVTEPMPSMPLFFWNDLDNKRYLDSYFSMYSGIWRHGDWVKITPRGGAVIYGRSDATINRQGVRMGTSELYRAVDAVEEVLDSLVIDVDLQGKPAYMPLFVVLREGYELDEALIKKIKTTIRNRISPRHVPDDLFAVPDVPRTLSGKKLEVPIKKLFMGVPIERAANLDAMGNPEVIAVYAALADQVRAKLAEQADV